MIEKEIIEQFEQEYLSKILGFCYQKTNSREDAEDLASEIALEVWKAVHGKKEIDNFNAFVWSVSNHTFFKWLRSKKRSSTAYLTELFTSPDNTEEQFILKEQKNLLHREIAFLAENYRKATVLYYFEEKSCTEIATILNKSVGTIKYWLHDSRKTIKEGLNTMREYGEKSYNPRTLFMSCQGLPGVDNEPMSCAKRKLPQNILLAAYNKPLTIEKLCMELGTTAPYIEDEIKNLIANQLMKETSSGMYQTDFVILPGTNISIAHKIYNACFPDYYNELMKFLEQHKTDLTSQALNTAGFTWERLLWIYIHITTDLASSKFKHDVFKTVEFHDIPNRPNGGKWIALGYNNGWFFNHDKNENEWKEYVPFDGPVHKTNKEFAQGYFHYWSRLDSNVFFKIPDGVFALCREIIKGNLSVYDLADEQKYLFSIAVEKKLFVKDGSEFKQNYYFVERKGWEVLEKLAYELYIRVEKYFNKAYKIVINEYKRTIPKHLHWQMGNFLSNHMGSFVTCSLYEGVKSNTLSKPDENSREWLSLFSSEE